MEFWIAFTVTFIIGSIYSYGKRINKKEQGRKHTANTIAKTKSTTEHQQKLDRADELVII